MPSSAGEAGRVPDLVIASRSSSLLRTAPHRALTAPRHVLSHCLSLGCLCWAPEPRPFSQGGLCLRHPPGSWNLRPRRRCTFSICSACSARRTWLLQPHRSWNLGGPQPRKWAFSQAPRFPLELKAQVTGALGWPTSPCGSFSFKTGALVFQRKEPPRRGVGGGGVSAALCHYGVLTWSVL